MMLQTRHIPKGQTLPWVMLIMALILALVFSNLDRMHLAALKIKQQRKTDAIAMKMGAEYSRSLNALASINDGIDQMAKQFIFYAGTSLATLGILIFSGVGLIYFLNACFEFGKGLKKILKGLKAIGEDFNRKIQKIDQQIFPNLCQVIQQEKIILLKHFLEDYGDVVLAQVNDTSFTSLDHLPTDAVSTISSLLKHPLAYSYPDVCDPDIQKQWRALTRVESDDSFIECKSMSFKTYKDYLGYRDVDWAKGSLVSGSVVFQEELEEDQVGTRQPLTLIEHYGASTASDVPSIIIRDVQGRESKTAQTPFEFISGQFEVCMDAKKIWQSIGNTLAPFPIPDYIQVDETFPNKNKIMVAVVQPYISIKPFQHSTDLAQFDSTIETPWGGINDAVDTYQEYQQNIQNIARTIDQLFEYAQMVTTYAQVNIEGKDGQQNLTGMHFFPKLMDTTLETLMQQQLDAEFH